MSDRAYLDTSAIVSLVDASEPRHHAARTWLAKHGDGSLIAHVAVIAEAIALVERRYGRERTHWLTDTLLPSVAIFHGTEVLNIRAMYAFRAGSGRNRPSMTDCLSFETMREFELDTAFAFDDDFVEAGFTTVP